MQTTTAQLPLFARAPFMAAPSAIDVHALSIPARTFTGDFYFAEHYASTLWFAVGDVSGKGIGAAVFMAMIQEQLEERIDECASASCDPAVTAARLDAFLKPLLPSNRFASAVVGSIDAAGTLRLTNAGHCPPLVARGDGSIESIASTGPILGMLPGAFWRSAVSVLSPGETVLVYSDGVIEAENEAGEEFGVERLREAFAKVIARGAPDAREIASAVEGLVRQFAPRYQDDLTIVAVRRN